MPYSYSECENLYQTQFSLMSLTPEGLRYLKVRSLIDSEPLTNSPSLRQWLNVQWPRFKRDEIKQLRVRVFEDNSISSAELDNQLRSVYQEIIKARKWDIPKLEGGLRGISRTGDEYWRAWNSVYRDNIRAHIQYHFVRTPKIQDYTELLRKIDKELDPIIKGYTVISWYNQWTSALIEHMIFSHARVVPAARRIDKVDFFFLDVPIDLKVTVLPEGYLTHLRRKGQISDVLKAIDYVKSEPLDLAKWLYENQGEARFSDSHRLFIVLVDARYPEQSWKLKSEFSRIRKVVHDYLARAEQLPQVTWEFQGQHFSRTFTTYADVLIVTNQ